MWHSCSSRGPDSVDRRVAPSTPPRNAETPALLTAGAFIVADREEWETRDIRLVVSAVKVFPLFVKAVYPRKRNAPLTADKLALGRSRWMLTRANGPIAEATLWRNGRLLSDSGGDVGKVTIADYEIHRELPCFFNL